MTSFMSSLAAMEQWRTLELPVWVSQPERVLALTLCPAFDPIFWLHHTNVGAKYVAGQAFIPNSFALG